MSTIRPCRPVRSVRSRVALVLSILFLGVFGVGSSAGGATHKATSLRNVVVVGDSITYLAAGSIEDVVGSQYRTFLVYKVGMRIDQMLPGLGVALLAHAPCPPWWRIWGRTMRSKEERTPTGVPVGHG